MDLLPDPLRTTERSISETRLGQEFDDFLDIENFSRKSYNTPSSLPGDGRGYEDSFRDDYDDDMDMDEVVNKKQPQPNATAEETSVAPEAALMPNLASSPSQFNDDPITPPQSQTSGPPLASVKSTRAPNTEEIQDTKASELHARVIEQEPDVKEEFETLPHLSRKTKFTPQDLEQAIDLTEDTEDDDEVVFVKVVKTENPIEDWNDVTKDEDDEMDEATDPILQRHRARSRKPTAEDVLEEPEQPEAPDDEPLFVPIDQNGRGATPPMHDDEEAQEDGRENDSDDNLLAALLRENNTRDANYRPDSEEEELHGHRLRKKSGKEPKPRKTRGPRARTAREWHKREQAKPEIAQRRGLAWKQEQLAKLHHRVEIGTRKRKAPKATKQPNRKRVDPRTFLGGGPNDNDPASKSSRRSGQGEGGQIRNSSTTKKNWWKDFMEQNHGIDLHRCTSDKNVLIKKSVTFGYNQMQPAGALPSGASYWHLEGMDTLLHAHQLIGVAFMIERECSNEGPQGSICADDMGLGKTIQAIAAIIGNPPTPEHIAKGKKTTLIVVPSSIQSQWMAELRDHAGLIGQNVMKFRSGDEDITATRLKLADVVVTTYWELFMSLPHPSKQIIQDWIDAKPKVDLFRKLQEWVEEHKHGMALLHQIDWYRIVLDEGHFIKNYMSRTSRAAIALKGELRLILSGTPIMNGYEEFHPLLRFLREPLTFNLTHEEFSASYGGEATDEEAVQSLSILISDLIIRRTMQDEMFDKPIVELPYDHRSITKLTASRAEMILIGAFVQRLKEFTCQTFEKGDERRPLRHPFARLTRQRQMTANVDIISRQVIAAFTVNELEALQKIIGKLKKSRSKKDMAHMVHSRLKTWIREKKTKVYENATPEDDDDEEITCMRCKMPAEELVELKSCKHIFCDECIQQNAIKDWEDESEVTLCPKCGKPFKPAQCRLIKVAAAATTPEKGKPKRAKTAIVKAKDFSKFRPSPGKNQLCFSRWLDSLDQGKIDLLPCAKLTAIKNQVRDWLKEVPDDKIIVFTQFRHFQVMIGRALEELKINFVYFSGDMSKAQRKKAIDLLKNDGTLKVMVAGLKCGGLGLNLISASRVIVADMWWNSCIDNQAFGRVFRMGQKKETHYVKMSVNDTIDERLLLVLQRKKEKKYQKVMQDDLTVDELDEVLGGSNETFEEYLCRINSAIQPDYRDPADDSE